MRLSTTLMSATAVLFGAVSCETSARTEPGCNWSERNALPPHLKIFLSMIFSSPKERYRPLRLRPYIRPQAWMVDPNRPNLNPGMSVSDYVSIDKKMPFELHIYISGMAGKAGASSSLNDKLGMPNMGKLAYPKNRITVENVRSIDPSVFGYFNVIPQTTDQFEKKEVPFAQSELLRDLVEVTEEYHGTCRIRSYFNSTELKFVFLYNKIGDGSETDIAIRSVCEARAQAIMFGFSAFTIPRIIEADRTRSLTSFSANRQNFNDLTQLLFHSAIEDALRLSNSVSYGEVCSFVVRYEDPPGPFRRTQPSIQFRGH